MGSDLALSGLNSGLDWNSVINKLMTIEAQPLQQMLDKQSQLQNVANAWKSINGSLLTLQSQAEGLASADNLYAMTVTSSDTGVLTASASGKPGTGDYSVVVNAVAQGEVLASASLAADSSTALNKTGTMQINGASVQVQATDSLATLRDRINGTPNVGVTASVVQVSTQPAAFQLVLTDNEIGATAGAIQLSDPNGILGSTTVIQAAQDAKITVNGSLVAQQTSNTFTDVIPGITVVAKKASAAGTSVGLSVDHNFDGVVNAVKAFADQYNTVKAALDKQASWDADTKQAGLLFGDPTLMTLQTRLRSLVTDPVPGTTAYQMFSSIGVSTGKWGDPSFGQLTVDESKLRSALATNIDAVGQLLGVNKTNVALATAGANATATAGGTATGFDPANLINGTTSSANWGQPGTGWQSSTPASSGSPNQVEIDFGQMRQLDEVVVYTLDSASQPANQNGIRDFQVSYFDGTAWKTVADVTGNQQGVVDTKLLSTVSAQKLRITVTGTNSADGLSRLVQVQGLQNGLGVGARLGSFIEGYTTAGTGLLDSKQQSLKTQMDQLGNSIEQMQQRLQMRQDTMRQQFIAMENALGALKEQSMALSGILGTLPSTSTAAMPTQLPTSSGQ